MQPDMMALAKGLSSSYFPISAVLLSRPIRDALAAINKAGELFGHGFTNSGHPVGSAIALETLRIYHSIDVIGHVRAMGARLRDGLDKIAADSSIVGQVRGEGLMFGVELVSNPATKAAFDPSLKVGSAFDARALENGLIIRAMGDTIGLCPPLIIKPHEVDEMLDLFAQTLKTVEAKLSPLGLNH
jgi:4-aminobutyrate--pyruvate transaminase